MSYDIPEGSPWKEAAVRFGNELRRALEARHAGWRQMNAALGKDVHSMLDRYKSGRSLPRLGQASLLAEALMWPELLELVRDARTKVCPIDGVTFVCDTGHGQKFCSPRCRDSDGKDRGRMRGYERQEAEAYRAGNADRVLVARLKQELERTRQEEKRRQGKGGYVRRREIRDAIAQWERTSPQSQNRRIRGQLNQHLAAVDAMCRACEPEGICRTAGCPLRAVSPLPFIPLHEVGVAERKPTAAEIWQRPGNTKRRVAHSIRMMAFHAEPGRKEQEAEATRRWWEGLTPEERVAHAEKIRISRQTSKHRIRDCGCSYRKHLPECPLRYAAAVT